MDPKCQKYALSLLSLLLAAGLLFTTAPVISNAEQMFEAGRASKVRSDASKMDADPYQIFVYSWNSSQFLDHVHQQRGVDCYDCHGMARPLLKSKGSWERCLKCHDMDKIRAKTEESGFNPHRAPHFGGECTLCHHAHEKSEMSCARCHTGYPMKY